MTLGKGKIRFGSDFTALITGVTVGAAGNVLDGGIGLIGVNEGSIASTVDETGGVLAITTDTADNDNQALVAGVFAPRDGTIVVNGRWKVNHLTSSVFFGLAETMAYDTPVMPAEFATATMTYNGSGGMVGIQYDSDGTTDDYRALMGNGGAGISDSSTTGVRANADVTVDQWIEGKVELFPDGSANVWLGTAADKNVDGEVNLKLVKAFNSGTLLTTTDVYHAVLMIENRDGNARVLEVDFFEGEAGRDWRYN